MYKDLEEALGYSYKDKNLLRHALSHSSYANEVCKDSLQSYERLEFLGDAILGFVTAEHLWRTYPTKPEGELTKIRAELVCEKNLAAVAKQIRLGDYLLLGHGESQGGGRNRSGILCDVMEALIAAAYLDSGFEEAKGIISRLILPVLAQISQKRDYKTELQELIQQKKDQHLSYEVLEETGPDHCKEFLIRVSLNGNELGRGSGSSKKRGEQAAACSALEFLGKV